MRLVFLLGQKMLKKEKKIIDAILKKIFGVMYFDT